MKRKVYIETTIPRYLTAWPSQDPVRTADQQITAEWWARRETFDLFVSRLVRLECRAGDPLAARDRLSALETIPILEQNAEAEELANLLLSGVPLPAKAEADALHIAMAAVNGMNYLLTWNCTHIANAVLKPRIETICRANRYEPPLVCTPRQLRAEDFSNDR